MTESARFARPPRGPLLDPRGVDAIAIGRALATLVAPPLCAGCGRPCSSAEAICAACGRALERERGGRALVAGLGEVTWAARYQGVARELVAALKFGGRLRLATVLAGALARPLAAGPAADAIVAVPPAPARRRRRGFDPAELVAGALAAELGLPVARCLRRADGPRQVGRRRADRLASPPSVSATAPPPASVLLVDDVLTTGATLAACASALRVAGATRVDAAVFARALGDQGRAA